MKQKIFALFLILCGLCLNLKAETQGDVVGRVLDDSGAPLVGATVQMVNAKGGVTTDEDGYFRIPYTKEGAVRVKVSFVGYQTQTFVTITLLLFDDDEWAIITELKGKSI